MATTSVKLSDDMSTRLRRLADSKRRTPHWVMVEAINRYIEQEERKASFTRMPWPPGTSTSKTACTSLGQKRKAGSAHGELLLRRKPPSATNKHHPPCLERLYPAAVADTVTIVAIRHQREAGFEGQGGDAA